MDILGKALCFVGSSVVANLGTLLVGIAGVLIAMAQYRRSRTEATLKFFEDGNSEEHREARKAVYRKSNAEIKNIAEKWKNGGTGEDWELTKVISFYDDWGRLVVQHYLPLRTFDGMSGVALIRIYKKLEPYINERREKEAKESKNDLYRAYAYYFEELKRKVENRQRKAIKKKKYQKLS